MNYDPNRTTVLPPMGFPITEELPVVKRGRGPGGNGPGGSGFLKIAAVLLIAAMIAIAAVLIISSQRSNEVAPTDDGLADPTPVVDQQEPAAPTAVKLDDVEPGFWQVTGVADGLNVRSGPGTNNDIVGSVRAGDRHIFSTGERATVNGADWIQIAFGDNDTVGWVSARFLASDTAPDPNAPTPTAVRSTSVSVVCFQSQQLPDRIARLEFANRTSVSGLIRTIDAQTEIDQTVAGTLADGRALMTLTTQSTGASSQRTWTFGAATVDLGNGTVLRVVDCAVIADQLP